MTAVICLEKSSAGLDTACAFLFKIARPCPYVIMPKGQRNEWHIGLIPSPHMRVRRIGNLAILLVNVL